MLLTAAVFMLWQMPAVVPLKILIVFFHEASHAIATFMTGGEVVSLSVSPNQGGACHQSWRQPFLDTDRRLSWVTFDRCLPFYRGHS